MKITTIGLTALLGAFGSLSAIERPAGEKAKEEIPAAPQGGIFEDAQNQEEGEAQHGSENVEKVAYLGVGGHACSEALVIHLNLKGGLLLTVIDPASPAGLAGLRENDIITAVGSAKLVDQKSLRESLFGLKPGEEVLLKLIRAGERIDQKVTLGEAPSGRGRALLPQALVPDQAAMMRELLNKELGQTLGGLGDTRLQKELFEQLEKAFGGKGSGFQQLHLDLGANLSNGGDMKMGLQGIGSARLEDEDGSIEMKMQNGQRELKIHDKEGGLLFVGPYNTPVDKAAVPDEYRERVERLDVGKKNSFKLELNGKELFQNFQKNSEKGE